MTGYPKIWFLRHGETEWNAERRIQGQLESQLTPRGIGHAEAQARLIAPILETDPPCFVSPLGRAQHTAEIALGGRPFTTDPRLAEAHAGDWQGRLSDEVRRSNPDLVDMETPSLDLFMRAPGGEGYPAFRDRILSFLTDLTEPSVVVAHGLLGQVMRGLVMGLPYEEMRGLTNEQACVYVLEQGRETVLRETA
ncbi:MAG: histidine phosphatase family protein [Marivita sp.]|uniref:histidine phosphatase family protein n=1 Tax=Marivita sp. TaxID=2003365 RepID=UPI001AFFAF7D|nr:histidine phosphatase family protein [Marivita sp.]MBO6884239.1 histidine phosphatase family protein [Marivita sp.]